MIWWIVGFLVLSIYMAIGFSLAMFVAEAEALHTLLPILGCWVFWWIVLLYLLLRRLGIERCWQWVYIPSQTTTHGQP